MRRLFDVRSAPAAFGWYVLVTLAMTWPLVRVVSSAVPSDLTDPILNGWILAWGADCLRGILGGNLEALARFWHPNIFHPEPLALAYSEHLAALVPAFLPVYALTRDVVLGYNLLFLSTFALSALGAYLLVRELTGQGDAAFLAGLLYGFALVRAQQLGHLQVLSSQWMPFALYGFRRYFERRSAWALSGGSLALVLQNLSCGYYLMFFSPVAALYILYEMADRRLLGDRRTWLHVAVAGASVALLTLPFLHPYLVLRQMGAEARPVSEVERFTPDVYSYLTPHEGLRVWGRLLPILRIPEGGLFPGLVTVALAAGGVFAAARRAWRASATAPAPRRGARLVVPLLSVVLAALTGWALLVLWSGPYTNLLRALWRPASILTNVWPVMAVVAVLLAALSPRFRELVGGTPGSTALFFAAIFALTFYLSLGRVAWSFGHRVTDETLYAWLYDHVPGFDGLRVPGRIAMVGSLCLAVLGGLGAAALGGRFRRGRLVLLAAGALFLVEASVVPLEVHPLAWHRRDAGAPGERTRAEMAPLYRWVGRLPAGSVVAELPFGDAEGETRAMLMSIGRWWPLANGYSGWFPASYRNRLEALGQPLADPGRAWRALVSGGVTAVVVHEWALEGRGGLDLGAWLRANGAREVAREGPDALYLMPPR